MEVENVCKNAGRCVNVGNSHRCQCQRGYKGSYCEEMVDECQSNPCRNGATCKGYQGTYECMVSQFFVAGVCVHGLYVFKAFMLQVVCLFITN